jgi:hypothetical protein
MPRWPDGPLPPVEQRAFCGAPIKGTSGLARNWCTACFARVTRGPDAERRAHVPTAGRLTAHVAFAPPPSGAAKLRVATTPHARHANRRGSIAAVSPEAARAAVAEGLSLVKAARRFGVSRNTIVRALGRS